jgi:BMFP domain-containing protein YqiC
MKNEVLILQGSIITYKNKLSTLEASIKTLEGKLSKEKQAKHKAEDTRFIS